MSELLGFIVLTGPLFLIVLWVPVCIALAVWIARKKIAKGWPVKIAAGLGLFLLFFVLPFADEIAGRIYLNHLCETEGGEKIYHRIELPAEYWDANGNPKFLKSNGDVLWASFNSQISEKTVERKASTIFPITDYRHVVKDSSGETLAEVVNFMYWGGWLIRATTASNAAVTCERKNKRAFWYEFYSKLFQPTGKSEGSMNNGNN